MPRFPKTYFHFQIEDKKLSRLHLTRLLAIVVLCSPPIFPYIYKYLALHPRS